MRTSRTLFILLAIVIAGLWFWANRRDKVPAQADRPNDPWVFRSDRDGLWHMLVTARAATGTEPDRGVLGHGQDPGVEVQPRQLAVQEAISPGLLHPRHGTGESAQEGRAPRSLSSSSS